MKKFLQSLIILGVFTSGCAHLSEPLNLTKARSDFARAEQLKAQDLVPEEYNLTKKSLETAIASHNRQEYFTTVESKAYTASLRAEALLYATQDAGNRQRIALIDKEKLDLAKRNSEANDVLRVQQELLLMKEREITLRQKELDRLEKDREKFRQDLIKAISEIARVEETKRGLVVSFTNVLFDTNKASIKPGAQKNLQKVATLLREYPDRMISIEGHTDNVGSDTYNYRLSNRRSESVMDFLEVAGVPGGRLTSKGFGEELPVATNSTPEGRQQNRRVDIVILNPGASPVPGRSS